MSKLDYFRVEIKPYVYAGAHGGEEQLYRIEVQANGEKFTIEEPSRPPAYMSELDHLMRLTQRIKAELEKRDED